MGTRLGAHQLDEVVLLGIDVGTTFCKAAVVAPDGRELAHGRARTPWQPVRTGAEIAPDALVRVACEAAEAALAAGPGARIAGVGVTSMAETGVLLGRDGRPVAAAIAWHDARGEQEGERLGHALGQERFVATTGLPVSRLCSAAKYSWMMNHIPQGAGGVRWLNVAEWVVRELGGEEAAELSLTSRTGWLDRSRRGIWAEALDASGAPASLLPDPVLAGTDLGRVTRGPEGLRGAAITIAGHDHVCASVGAGALGTVEVFNSCGTAEAYVRAVDAPISGADAARAVSGGVAAGCHVVPDKDALMGGFTSGLVLDRWLRVLGKEDVDRDALDEAALSLPPDGLVIDEGPAQRSDAAGLPEGGSPEQVWRSVIESLARRGRSVLTTIEEVSGPSPGLVVTGGVTRGRAFREIKRRIVAPFVVASVEEAGARGAALLGGCAAGIYPDVTSVPAPLRED